MAGTAEKRIPIEGEAVKTWDGRLRADARYLPIANESVQCVVTSPPYWGLRDYGHQEQIGLEPTVSGYVDSLRTVFLEIWRVLRADGTVWLNLGDSYHSPDRGGYRTNKHRWEKSEIQRHNRGNQARITPNRERQEGLKDKDLVGIPWRVALDLQVNGWYLRRDIIWHKPNPMPESVTDRPTTSHEYIFLLTKAPVYFYDADAIKELADPLAGRDTTTTRRQTKPGMPPDSGFKHGHRFEYRNKRSVWTVSTTPYTGAHYATFPQKLVETCILAGSRAGDLVLDPFFGSGTIGLVAERLSRRWMGCDLGYQDLQSRRLSNVQRELIVS